MSLLATKSIEQLTAEANESGAHALKRVLGVLVYVLYGRRHSALRRRAEAKG